MSNPPGQTLPASEALRLLTNPSHDVACLDVRSEDEFACGAIPLFSNRPILNNEERHLVGLCYKTEGQNQAVELGYKLVSPHREARVKDWIEVLSKGKTHLVSCWRGGMRSQIATEWLQEKNFPAIRVEGGTKALRGELLKQFENLPELIVIAGPTGAGKTKLINSISTNKVDLEGLAHHRGSAFGRQLLNPQPSQATFENNLAFELLKIGPKTLFLENESLAIGSVHLPNSLFQKINRAVIVKINMSLEDRVANLFTDYVTQPLADGISREMLRDYYHTSLTRIKNKLGGLKESQLHTLMAEAFQNDDSEKHHKWIQELLTHYYDKTYEHSLNKTPHPIAYEGDWNSCLNWIQNQYA